MRRSQRKQVEPDLGILSSRSLFNLQRELFTKLSEQGHPELRPRHGAVMAYLDEEGSRATDLAAQSGQHKQVIGTLVDELVALGYVERQPDPADRRAKLIVPTEKGRDHMVKSDAILAEMEAEHAKAVGEEAYAQFKRVFRLVVERQTGSGLAQ
ncbi:Transcriptional regulator, MarR family [[Actinomadura] parvosata subsp. kistnae]|uniref:MarR family transcriptional regulator n=1 Tax=[Actinomadura] parvosata subsp. kistnae TaxID=1909395 RepID=A0A1V0ALQ5_9ACTN|nr:MarR family winged helix-turn-helix transcriptional regulator [Nonomuraea sp. ATCC 55076]AQZ71161.1 MarR family transcriptional regulator [Nonomuraea sp. ATCC 55076]SPL93764.1 Transcriptional regulator, MarR family [Actinomadura parvosata subsp. kistnae]